MGKCFLWCLNMLVLQPLYKSLIQSCDLRRRNVHTTNKFKDLGLFEHSGHSEPIAAVGLLAITGLYL